MKEPRVLVRMMLLLSFLFSGVLSGAGAHSAAAQADATSYDSPVTGASIRTTGPWTIDTGSIESSSDMEMLLLYGQYDGMLISFLPAGTDLVTARDIFLEEFSSVFGSFVPVDRGAYGNVSYSLDITSSEGTEFGVFSLFLGQRASGYVEYYLYFGPVLYFEEGFASAQQNVTVNGDAVFEGVDGGGLQDLLAANAGVTGASTERPNENVVDAGPTEAPSLATEAAPAPTNAPVPAADAPVDDGEAGDAYISSIESEIAYLQTTLDTFSANYTAIVENSANQEAVAAALQELNRIAAEWDAYPDRAASIVAPPGYEDIDASYRALVSDVDALAGLWDAVVSAAEANDQEGISTAIFDLVLATLDVEISLEELTTLIAERETVASQSAQPTPTEELEDVPTEEPADLTGPEEEEGEDQTADPRAVIPELSEVEEGEDGPVANETETGRGGQEPDLSDYEDLGLLSEGEYVSPQFEIPVAWGEQWVVDYEDEEPLISDPASGVDSLSLLWAGDDLALLFIDISAAEGLAPADFVDYWASDEYLEENADPSAEVLLDDSTRTSGAVLTRDYLSEGDEVIILREAVLLDGGETLAIVTLIATPAMYGDVYGDAEDDVEIDGEPAVSVFSQREVERAVDQ